MTIDDAITEAVNAGYVDRFQAFHFTRSTDREKRETFAAELIRHLLAEIDRLTPPPPEPAITIEEANALARGRLHVEPDDIDPALWCVIDGEVSTRNQVHEPMSREKWLDFIERW